MRSFVPILCLCLLTSCFESRFPGDDGTPRDASSDTPIRRDAIAFDVPVRVDGGPLPRDAAPGDTAAPRDTAPIDAPPDAGGFDLVAACDELCERALGCGLAETRGECIGGCVEIEELFISDACVRLGESIFECAAGVFDCMELESVFEGGRCAEIVEDLERSCRIVPG